MTNLSSKKCIPCQGGVPSLTTDQIKPLQKELGSSWQVINNHHLTKEFIFDDFKQALAFTNKVGEIAEAEGHHPDIYLAWGKVKITIWTHKIDGLTESDFILGAKIDQISSA